MATIQRRERKSGTVYLADVRIHGFPRQKKTFKRLTDARLWAQQTEAAIRKGEFQDVIQTSKRKTLKDVISRYRKEVLPHKAATTRRMEGTFLTYWEGMLGEYALSYIDAELVSSKLQALAVAGDGRRKPAEDAAQDTKPTPRPKSRKTVKHYRDTLELLFKYAKQWGWTGSNPLDGVNRVTKINNARTRYLSDDERKALLDACQASPNKQLYPIVVFALSTGARRGEILGLQMNDLNLSNSTATLRDTKNGETRVVPVVKHLKAELKKHLAWRAKKLKPLPEPGPWVFPRFDGAEPIDIRAAWENAREQAKLVDFRFHDLRHADYSDRSFELA